MQKKRFTGEEFLSRILNDDSASSIFDKIEGFDITGNYTGVFSVGLELSEVCIEADDTIKVSMPARLPKDRASALKTNHRLPGNTRFAILGQESWLLADTKVDGEAHLPKTFRLMAAGFRQAQGNKKQSDFPKESESAMSKAEIHEVLAQMAWEAEALVEQDGGYELRPRVRGEILPVHLQSEGTTIRLHRPVVNVPPSKTTAAIAVCNLALRLNAQLRHVRLAEHDGKLVCELQLHTDLIQPVWVSEAAYAVAVAWRHVQLLLRIVAEQERVADTYVHMFCSENEWAAFCGAAK